MIVPKVYLFSSVFNMIQLPSLADYLSCDCECFQNETFLTKNSSKKPIDYVQKEKLKCEFILDQVNKHQIFDINTLMLKPCYGVSSTTAIILRTSLLRHQHSIKRLKIATKKLLDIYIAIENGKNVSVTVYIQTIQQHINTLINTWIKLFRSESVVCTSELVKSENNHIQTLKVLENVIKSPVYGFDQLEISVKPPE